MNASSKRDAPPPARGPRDLIFAAVALTASAAISLTVIGAGPMAAWRSVGCFFAGALPLICVIIFRKRIRFVTAFGLISLVIFIGGFETGLRVRPLDTYHVPYFIGRGFATHPYLFWAPEDLELLDENYARPKDASLPGYGKFRSGKALLEKRPGLIRVMTMGESNAWGFGIKNYTDTFTARLEQLAKRRYPEKDLEFICAAKPGSILIQNLILYKLSFRNYHPDLVIFYGNINDVQLVSTGPQTFREMFKARTGVDLSRLYIDEFEFPKKPSLSASVHGVLDVLRSFQVFRAWITAARDRSLPPKRFKDINSVEDYRSNLRDLIAIVHQDGAKIVLADAYQNYTPPPGAPIGRRRQFSMAMESVAAETHTPFLPIMADFQKRFTPEQLLLPEEREHLNEFGHAELAKEILSVIERENLLGP